ncbi:hypothetical protein RHS01_09621 [Rhizoctonia solani]|uniref:Uncharacterized protein n=1 Tax=Rhizoctonia solani TaxID=456999 RepID=A0A8H7I648_9AGAM|nr:hypothetical protein RHS01_09621 [Rhizoctonia solani]
MLTATMITLHPTQNHPDPLERRIHAMPDVEVFLMADDHPPQWFLGVDLAHALHGAYYHALQVFGDAVQPTGWNRHDPWGNYDYASKLEEINFPYIPRPICFTSISTTSPLTPSMNYSAKSTTTISMSSVSTRSIIINATKQNHYSNLAHVGYIRGSPACVSAHRFCFSPPALEEFAEQIFNYAAWGLEPPSSLSPTESTGWDSNTAIHSLRRSLSPARRKQCRRVPCTPNSSNYELDVNALTEQLAQVAVVQDADPAPPSFSADFVESIWEWPGEPQPSPTWDLLSGPPYRSSTRLRFHGKTIGTRFAPAT